ncbi:MAG: IS110 family transposase [Bacteroidota bacterium]
MKFSYFLGVDVSKNKLDIALFKGNQFIHHRVIGNNPTGIGKYVKELKQLDGFNLSNSVFCMEHTGIYNNPLLSYLHKKKGNTWLQQASQIKNSLGNIRGKHDKVDAIRIGEYLYKNREDIQLWKPKREVVVKLDRLTVVRDRLLDMRKQLTVPLGELSEFVPKSLVQLEKRVCQKTLEAIKADLEKVDRQIDKTIQEDPQLNALFNIITSVPSVGTQTAARMIICTNEFQDIKDPKKFACYSGVAPFRNESGLFKGRSRVSHMANKKMKSLLHMCAIVAIVYNNDLKAYYQRKVKEGKNKMSVINAVRNKLVHRIFSCVNQNRKYENSYSSSLV